MTAARPTGWVTSNKVSGTSLVVHCLNRFPMASLVSSHSFVHMCGTDHILQLSIIMSWKHRKLTFWGLFLVFEVLMIVLNQFIPLALNRLMIAWIGCLLKKVNKPARNLPLCQYHHVTIYIYIYIWLSAKRCACKGLCTSVENKTLLKTVFIWNDVLCTCMNEWIHSTDNFSNQAVVDFKIELSHTEKAPKNYRQKLTSMYRVIFVTLLTNKSQAHGETITDLYAENIILYG